MKSSPSTDCPEGLEAALVHPAASSDDNASDTLQPALRTPPGKRTVRVLKPLLILTTAQYTLVTVLAGLSAIIIASGAGKAINASLAPVIAALKRF